MSSDRPSIPPARPTQFVVGEDERGNPKLDVVEGTFEQTYRVGDHHSVALFLALSKPPTGGMSARQPELGILSAWPRRTPDAT